MDPAGGGQQLNEDLEKKFTTALDVLTGNFDASPNTFAYQTAECCNQSTAIDCGVYVCYFAACIRNGDNFNNDIDCNVWRKYILGGLLENCSLSTDKKNCITCSLACDKGELTCTRFYFTYKLFKNVLF